MDHLGYFYDIALSFAGEDRLFVEEVARHLKARDVRVFYDKDEEVDLWGKEMVETLDSVFRLRSTFVVLFVSQHYSSKMWTNLERKSAFARAMQKPEEYVLPARFDDTDLPGLLPTVQYVDLRRETPRTFASKLVQKLALTKNSNAPNLVTLNSTPATERTHLFDSLRARLKRDFFTGGLRAGEFGKERIKGEVGFYRDIAGEVISHKPHYYMTYWGWKLMPWLLPELVDERSLLTVDALRTRFAGKRWIEVDIESYDFGPASTVMTAETVRHTVKAAEILLFIHVINLPSQVAWNLINEVQFLSTQGGWKEFRGIDSKPSLWSSVYVFRFLSKLKLQKCDPGAPGETQNFIDSSKEILQTTENYLETCWHENKWSFNRLPWEVNAPVLLIECILFLQNEALVNEVFEAFRKLITPAGSLVNPDLGTAFKAPEYVLSVRLAYALKLCCLLNGNSDSRVDNLETWVLDNYSENHTLDTCDLAFLYGLFRSTTEIAS